MAANERAQPAAAGREDRLWTWDYIGRDGHNAFADRCDELLYKLPSPNANANSYAPASASYIPDKSLQQNPSHPSGPLHGPARPSTPHPQIGSSRTYEDRYAPAIGPASPPRARTSGSSRQSGNGGQSGSRAMGSGTGTGLNVQNRMGSTGIAASFSHNERRFRYYPPPPPPPRSYIPPMRTYIYPNPLPDYIYNDLILNNPLDTLPPQTDRHRFATRMAGASKLDLVPRCVAVVERDRKAKEEEEKERNVDGDVTAEAEAGVSERRSKSAQKNVIPTEINLKALDIRSLVEEIYLGDGAVGTGDGDVEMEMEMEMDDEYRKEGENVSEVMAERRKKLDGMFQVGGLSQAELFAEHELWLAEQAGPSGDGAQVQTQQQQIQEQPAHPQDSEQQVNVEDIPQGHAQPPPVKEHGTTSIVALPDFITSSPVKPAIAVDEGLKRMALRYKRDGKAMWSGPSHSSTYRQDLTTKATEPQPRPLPQLHPTHLGAQAQSHPQPVDLTQSAGNVDLQRQRQREQHVQMQIQVQARRRAVEQIDMLGHQVGAGARVESGNGNEAVGVRDDDEAAKRRNVDLVEDVGMGGMTASASGTIAVAGNYAGPAPNGMVASTSSNSINTPQAQRNPLQSTQPQHVDNPQLQNQAHHPPQQMQHHPHHLLDQTLQPNQINYPEQPYQPASQHQRIINMNGGNFGMNVDVFGRGGLRNDRDGNGGGDGAGVAGAGMMGSGVGVGSAGRGMGNGMMVDQTSQQQEPQKPPPPVSDADLEPEVYIAPTTHVPLTKSHAHWLLPAPLAAKVPNPTQKGQISRIKQLKEKRGTHEADHFRKAAQTNQALQRECDEVVDRFFAEWPQSEWLKRAVEGDFSVYGSKNGLTRASWEEIRRFSLKLDQDAGANMEVSGTTQDSSQDIDDGWDLEEFKRVVGPEFQEVLHRMTRTIEQDKQQDTEPVPLPFNESDQSARTVAEYMRLIDQGEMFANEAEEAQAAELVELVREWAQESVYFATSG